MHKPRFLSTFSQNVYRYSLFGLLVICIGLLVQIFVLQVHLQAVMKENQSISQLDKDVLQLIRQCRNDLKNPYEENCYAKQFISITQEHDLAYVLALLEALKQARFKGDYCHNIAHAIAVTEVSKRPERWIDVINEIDTSACTRGFLHGVLEGRQKYDANFVLNEQTISLICDETAKQATKKRKSSQIAEDCPHTLGHVLLVQEQGNIQYAVASCEKLPAHYVEPCYRGVFMENMRKETLKIHGIVPTVRWNTDNVQLYEQSCNSFPDTVAIACWQSMPEAYITLARGDQEKVYEYCQRAPKEGLRDACYLYAVGTITFLSTVDKLNIGTGNQLCQPYQLKTEKHRQCMSFVIEYLALQTDTHVERLVAYCEATPRQYQEYCYQYIGTKVEKNGAKPTLDMCQLFPPAYRRYCLMPVKQG